MNHEELEVENEERPKGLVQYNVEQLFLRIVTSLLLVQY